MIVTSVLTQFQLGVVTGRLHDDDGSKTTSKACVV
jgi:hypothetical protein